METKQSKNFTLLMSFAVGVMAANIYYTQPILSLIAESLHLRADASGLVMTLTQIGYGLGVLFVIPLGDLFENKKLILIMIGITIIAELTLGFSKAVVPYFAASVLAGLGASSVQIMVPYSSQLFDKAERGKILGSIMSGLMLGIMLSRPLASFMTDLFSFHAVFFVSSGIMTVLLFCLVSFIPKRTPEATGLSYVRLIWSMKELLVRTPILQRRSFYQAMMFGAFCVFWTTVPLLLIDQFHFTQKNIALFALAGVAGAIIAPVAGRLADKGFARKMTLSSFILGILSFVLSHFIEPGSTMALVILIVSANLLDAGVSAHLVLGQRAIFLIDPRNQSRMNGLYIGILYVGGAMGSALGAWAYLHGGWKVATLAGAVMPVLALLLFLTEKFSGYVEA
jgi:predicted MFS family arabinose efflux permease